MKRPVHSYVGASVLLALVFAFLPSPARAQEEEEKIPEPQEMTLDTEDGVVLHCTYFPSLKGKEAVPVILLHGLGGSQHDVAALAKTLQENRHAVLIGDLRGHGASTKVRLANGDQMEIKHDDMRPNVFAFVYRDVEAMKTFLLAENNKGKLNIELLCVVGADLGAVLALNWAVWDWHWTQLPAYKQGRDVKALVLISPRQSIKGLGVSVPLRNPVVREHLSLMIVCGTQARDYADAKRLYNSFKRYHPLPPREEREEMQDLFLVDAATSLSGTDLLDAEGLDIHRKVLGFINLRLVNKADRYPWKLREKPL